MVELTETFRILIVTRTALLASFAYEVEQARTFARGITHLRSATNFTTAAGPAIWVTVVARQALVTAWATISSLTQTFSS